MEAMKTTLTNVIKFPSKAKRRQYKKALWQPKTAVEWFVTFTAVVAAQLTYDLIKHIFYA